MNKKEKNCIFLIIICFCVAVFIAAIIAQKIKTFDILSIITGFVLVIMISFLLVSFTSAVERKRGD